MNINFEKIDVPPQIKFFESGIVANPKAVAAQAYKSVSIQVEFYESRVWEHLARFFERQYSIQGKWKPDIQAPLDDRWIVYPFSVVETVQHAGCIVWDVPEGRPRIRHLRIYRNQFDAEVANAEIAKIISGAI